MKAHMVMKVYSNSNSAVKEVYTSRSMAEDHIQRFRDAAKLDKMTMEVYDDSLNGETTRFYRSNGDFEDWYVDSREMRRY